ncbi:transcription elongation factor GreA [Candidatus Giovannonibacteria bacterium RIFCSPHIGHO2_02_42_15]|uniref:Transcription elongation factor GreA n=2 Tax=Candidatus Giovannoniibacteriota TaxID=1752738 RepID=A0A1F5VMK3_9BACT|nr:MAG: Transcription elongation factor GreA [Candidatus Giovannonibacteria bacterium GW2011_GWF2_42_19]OGF64662.1 MAG: transcription elongation factor GreA [Candidatus Giovannonibacteria bacterium RIFCSPHIGHO2_02_42_15]
MNVIHNDAEYLSEEGFTKLKGELANLKENKRKEIAARLEYAKSLGDLSENAEYHEAKEDQLSLEARIAELEDILSRAVLISHTENSFVNIGSCVKALKNGGSEEETYCIVGSEEANPSEKRISNESPIGKALLGKKKGEMAMVHTPKGEIQYKILDIQ